MRNILHLAGALSLLTGAVNGLQVDFTADSSIKEAASTIAFGLLKYYTGNNTGDVPGNLPAPYFWWEAGAMFGTLIDYWFYTGDDTYNDLTLQGMVHQAGDDQDFMPINQTRTEGNDDQGFWGMAAMSAAENDFPNPPSDQPQWLALAQAVFNEYVTRWDPANCGGGLRWQIFTFNNGFNYKNSIANGCFFNIASRLARFTGNQTYADWAEKVFDWMQEIKFMDEQYNIFDGAGTDQNCSIISPAQWTYNAGIYLHGAAVMYNFTNGSSVWQTRTQGLMQRAVDHFFEDGVVVEQACEPFSNCDNDQQSFKGYLLRWFTGTATLAPFTFNTLMPLVRSSAAAAVASCTGSPPAGEFNGPAGTACGFKWANNTGFDGVVGVGEQMSALSATQYSLVQEQTFAETKAPVTSTTGGTSKGNPNAGINNATDAFELPPVTLGERVAAGFATSAIVLSVIGGSVFVMKS
ncbi:glycoside hydrolase family 76 protein [Xylariaceae sp. FL0255]|nr:glycoside hydrolase family 76 protein [Xylariaceae sp. FL0255]